MSKLKKIKNGEYIGGDKYTITPDAGGKSKIVFSPDSILTEPTPVGAEILNEMQLNEVYTLDTVRSVDGQKEIYTATLEGFTEFDNPDLNFNLKINSENTNSQTYLRLNNIDYLIECKIGNLKAGSIVYAKKINNTIKIIGNKNFGTNEGDILEGSKLAEILGIEYGGILNNANAKVAGKGYYDTANKKIYKCTANTSINYADAGYFIEVSNNDLLGKLQNIIKNKWFHQFSIFGADTNRYETRKLLAIPSFFTDILVRSSPSSSTACNDGTILTLSNLSAGQRIPVYAELVLKFDWYDSGLGFYYFFVENYEDPQSTNDNIEIYARI